MFPRLFALKKTSSEGKQAGRRLRERKEEKAIYSSPAVQVITFIFKLLFTKKLPVNVKYISLHLLFACSYENFSTDVVQRNLCFLHVSTRAQKKFCVYIVITNRNDLFSSLNVFSCLSHKKREKKEKLEENL